MKRSLSKIKYKTKNAIGYILYMLFRVIKIQSNKVVATTMRARKYGDNPKYIVEQMLVLNPQLDIVWMRAKHSDFEVPKGIRVCNYNNPFLRIYEYATAKVWINSHRIESYVRKRKGQLFVETWHGGLGIKKIESDREGKLSEYSVNEIRNTKEQADVFISNSSHLTNIYHSAFDYNGPILKCGYPKNDVFFKDNKDLVKKVKNAIGVDSNKKICLYAPTFRDIYFAQGKVDFNVYNIDFKSVSYALKEHFDEQWVILVKWHPVLAKYVKDKRIVIPNTIDVTAYPDMQELILSADILISDYSSCIFDAVLREIPCFIFATDFEEYKKERGVYYELEELPFPYAKNNEEMIKNIKEFDHKAYIQKWERFKEKTGLIETGHASEIIANKILDFIDGKTVDWSI